MNINCSFHCTHQKNGKCSLKELEVSKILIGYGEESSKCPYFQRQQERIK